MSAANRRRAAALCRHGTQRCGGPRRPDRAPGEVTLSNGRVVTFAGRGSVGDAPWCTHWTVSRDRLNGKVRVFLYAGTCDMRRQIAGLVTMVRESWDEILSAVTCTCSVAGAEIS